jgi:hypothetical protein
MSASTIIIGGGIGLEMCEYVSMTIMFFNNLHRFICLALNDPHSLGYPGQDK